MTPKSPIILGIDTGTRQIGVTVFQGWELVFYGIKTITDKNDDLTLARMRRIIGGLIREYDVTYVAMEKIIFVQQHRSFGKRVFDEIRDFLKKLRIPYSEYNPKTVRQSICQNEKPTKANSARVLTEIYPELGRYFNAPRTWQKRYYALLLDAVAVGYVCVEENQPKDAPLPSLNRES
ncbi:MAG TPA: crossover junction endodeoxyribonuclease RuvC [Pyrinomonadaceae bacterium]|nr:crossover junction endodeoxyribonuclease RuvC [Pyrinomonadaceae bacterium]HMP65564.1 crossover junction endodeoxyribonuclease RuvC [Pyrinomonadaceae bacterium]